MASKATGAVLATCMSLVGPGCQSPRTAERELSAVLQRYYARGDRAASCRVTRPTEPRADQPPTTRPGALDIQPGAGLEQLVILALRRNPQLQAARRDVEAKLQRIPQVQALPDPQLQVGVRAEPIRTAAGDIYLELRLGQRFPPPEVLDRRGRVALQEARMAIQALRVAYNRVIAEVKRTYYQLYFVDRAIRITEQSIKLLQEIAAFARSRFRAGRATQQDPLRAQVELERLRAELDVLRQRKVSTVAAMNRLIDRMPDAPLPSPGDLDMTTVQARLQELLRQAVESNPELARLKQQIERDRQQVRLAKLAYVPEVTLQAIWTYLDPRNAFQPPPNPQTGQIPKTPQLSEHGTDSWGIMVGLNIPLWLQRIEAGIRQARERLRRSYRQYDSQRNRVYFEIHERLTRAKLNQRLAALYRDTIIPDARQTFLVSRSAYQAGQVDVLTLLDNWRRLLDYQVSYHLLISQLGQELASLEEAVGQELQPPAQATPAAVTARGAGRPIRHIEPTRQAGPKP